MPDTKTKTPLKAAKKAAKKTTKKAAKKAASKSPAKKAATPPGKNAPLDELLGERFMSDLMGDWESFGAGAIAECRTAKPDAYLRLVAAIGPKELAPPEDPLGDLSDDDLLKRLRAALEALEKEGVRP